MDGGASCAACLAAAASSGGTPWLAALKAISLGYLLSLPALSLAGAVWHRFRPHLAPQLRADAGFVTLAVCFWLQLALGWLIWYGVVSHRILMTTSYFHHLMYGGWSRGILDTGLGILAVSLGITAWSWRRAQSPRLKAATAAPMGDEQGEWQCEAAALGLRLQLSTGVGTAALTGVWRPVLFVNPPYWASLSAAQRKLALVHERQHLRRGDNLRKLLLDGIALFYGVLPGIRRWAAQYELDAELAVDDHCRQAHEPYIELISTAVSWLLSHPLAADAPASIQPTLIPRLTGASRWAAGDAPRSGLSQADLAVRLRLLLAPRVAGRQGSVGLALLACSWASAIPAALLLCHPVPRCLLACYLGY